MRMRYRKKLNDRQSLFNIHLADFIAEFNQTVEEAYKSLEQVLETVEGGTEADGLQGRSLGDTTDRPPEN